MVSHKLMESSCLSTFGQLDPSHKDTFVVGQMLYKVDKDQDDTAKHKGEDMVVLYHRSPDPHSTPKQIHYRVAYHMAPHTNAV